MELLGANENNISGEETSKWGFTEMGWGAAVSSTDRSRLTGLWDLELQNAL